MKAATIEAIQAAVAALQDLTEALQSEAQKSRGGADDEDTGEVSRPAKSSKVAAVSGKRKKPPVDVVDDETEAADPDDPDADEDAPPPKAAGRSSTKARKPKAAEVEPDLPEDGDEGGADADAGEEEDEATVLLRNKVKKMLAPHLEDPAVVKQVKAILKKYGATTVSDADPDSLPAIKKAVVNLIAEL